MSVVHAYSAGLARARSLAVLNLHLAGALVVRDTMEQSPRHRRGAGFIMIDDVCDRFARLMEGCADGIADRVTDLGGTPHWPDPFARLSSIVAFDTSAPVWAADSVEPESEPLDVFTLSLLHAADATRACGDVVSSDLLARIWLEIDRLRG